MNSIENQRTRSILIIKMLLFSASIIPAVVAGSMALPHENFRWLSFVLVTAGLFLGQAAGDYFYYYFTDFHTHTKDSHAKIFAGWKPLLIDTLLRPKDSLWAGILCLLLDLVILVYFVNLLGFGILWLAVLGAAIALLFTPIMLRGYKEPLIFFAFGPLSMFSAYFALTGDYSIHPVVVSIPIGLFITVVAYLKGAHYQTTGKGSDLVVLNITNRHVSYLVITAHLTIIAAVLFHYLNVWSLISLLTIIPAMFLVNSLKKESTINDYLKATVYSLVIMIITGLLLGGSIIKDI